MEAISRLVERFTVPLQGASGINTEEIVPEFVALVQSYSSFQFPPLIIVLYGGEYSCIDHNIALSHSMMLNTADCKRLVTSKLNSSTKRR